ncbi:unnamed protein product, partial [Darwinula stevensoni]
MIFFPVCGRRDNQKGLVAGGITSEFGDWPWQAAIYDVVKRDVICGGALVMQEWVLTAAHCLTVENTIRTRFPKDFRVYLGKHHRDISKDDEFVQMHQVSHIIVHEDFSLQNYDSDIALLHLAKPSILTQRVQLICLPDLTEVNLEPGNKGWVAGWGFDGLDNLSTALTEIELPVKSNK